MKICKTIDYGPIKYRYNLFGGNNHIYGYMYDLMLIDVESIINLFERLIF